MSITITSVDASDSSKSSPDRNESPPIESLISLLPVPIPWLIPEPARCMRQLTSCIPVPDAATIPIGPRRIWLANARDPPEINAVPQSGPITSKL